MSSDKSGNNKPTSGPSKPSGERTSVNESHKPSAGKPIGEYINIEKTSEELVINSQKPSGSTETKGSATPTPKRPPPK